MLSTTDDPAVDHQGDDDFAAARRRESVIYNHDASGNGDDDYGTIFYEHASHLLVYKYDPRYWYDPIHNFLLRRPLDTIDQPEFD